MRLFQHMLPLLLTELPEQLPARPVVPEGAVLMKAWDPITAIGGAVTAVAGVFTAGTTSRTAQELARQETMRVELMAMDAQQARAAQLAMAKYVAGAALVALTLYLILR